MIQITREDQASNIRGLIKACWDGVEQFSLSAQQLNEFGGSQQALEVVNTLINDFYIAIGSLEDALGSVDYKSTAIDTTDQVAALAQVAPNVVSQMATKPVLVAMTEKFTLDEGNTLNEEVEGVNPEIVEGDLKEVKDELKTVDTYRKKKVKEYKNDIEPIEECVSTKGAKLTNEEMEDGLEQEDESLDPHFYESLLKLED